MSGRALFARTPTVSPSVLAAILTTPQLRDQLFPDGYPSAPYRILAYHATLVLAGKRGEIATFRRHQRIEALADGLGAFLDHFWGDGVQLTTYRHSAGHIGASFRDRGRRHLVIKLPSALRRGTKLEFRVHRSAMHAFTETEEWVETRMDYPAQNLSRTVIFPIPRPALQAWHVTPFGNVDLPIHTTPDGHTQVQAHITNAEARFPYQVRWIW